MNVIFINDSTSNPNWGDRAAAIALQTMISSVGGRITFSLTEEALAHTLLGEVAPTMASVSPGRAKHVIKQFAPPALLTLGRRYFPHADNSNSRHFVPAQWKEYSKAARAVVGSDPWPGLTRAIHESDVVVIHGDGAISGNGIISRTMLFLAYLTKTFYAKPVVIVNHTADLDHPDLLATAHEVYPLFDDVVFRDPISAERCRHICNGRYAPDAAFLFEPARGDRWTNLAGRPTYFDVWPDSASFDPAKPYVCIGGSSILATAQDSTAILSGYNRLIDHLSSFYNGSIVLTVSDLVDQPIFRALSQELGLPLVGLRTPVQQAVDVLGNADAYIGGRWHPSIFALRGGTPIVPLSAKTAKMQALAAMVGVKSPLPDALNLEAAVEVVGQRLLECLGRGEELRSDLRRWADDCARNCWENVAYLKTL